MTRTLCAPAPAPARRLALAVAIAAAALAAAACDDPVARYAGQFEGTVMLVMTPNEGAPYTVVLGDILVDVGDLTGDDAPAEVQLSTAGDWHCVMTSDDASASPLSLRVIGCEAFIDGELYDLDSGTGHASRTGDELHVDVTGAYRTDTEVGGFTAEFSGVST